MKYKEQCILCPCNFVGVESLDITIVTKTTSQSIISGKLIDEDNSGTSGILIEVTKIKDGVSEYLGYTISGDDGEYFFGVEQEEGAQFKISLYKPLTK
ncbi:MAG: hypothetical protein ACRC7N_17710 [Clostridium sp.]